MAVDAGTADRELTRLTSTGAIGRDGGNETAAPDWRRSEEIAGRAVESAKGFSAPVVATPRWSDVRTALIVGLAVIVAMAGLIGWLGLRTYQSHQAHHRQDLYLQVARQGALDLTTISYVDVEADVRRILDSATGQFYDDFLQRSQPFMEVMRQAQATTEGTVTEAGVESEEDGQAQVLVAVSVKTSNFGVVEESPRLWRMRIGVLKIGDGAKVSDVQFVP